MTDSNYFEVVREINGEELQSLLSKVDMEEIDSELEQQDHSYNTPDEIFSWSEHQTGEKTVVMKYEDDSGSHKLRTEIVFDGEDYSIETEENPIYVEAQDTDRQPENGVQIL